MTVKKKISISVVSLILVMAFIAGCTTLNGTELFKAFSKIQDINSMETSSKLKINVSAQGLSTSDEETFNQVKDIINNTEITFFSKYLQNQDRTTLKSYTDISANSDLIPFKTQIWLNQNFSGGTPSGKEIIKSPMLFSLSMPEEFTDKYMVIDLAEMQNDPQTKDLYANVDFTKITQSNSELKQKIAEFIDKYVNQYDLGIDFITDKGTSQVSGEDVHLYQVKLSDANLKTIVRKIFNDYSQNKEAMDFIKDYMLLSLKSGGLSGTDLDSATKDMDELFTQISSESTKTEFNAFMDKLDNITLLGSKGIDITYAINKDGYIVNENGTIQLVFDVNKLYKLFNEESGVSDPTLQDLTGIYTVELNYETNNYNINTLEDKDFTLPNITAKNSFTLKQLDAALNPKPPKTPTITLSKKQSAKLYKKVYFIKVKDAVAKLKGKYSYSSGNATIKINGKTIKMQLGRKYIYLNGKKKNLKTINGIISHKKLYIPVNVYSMAGVKIKLK